MCVCVCVCVCVSCGTVAGWSRPLARNPRVVKPQQVFVILSIHENGMVVHLTSLHTSPPSCDGYLEFSRVQIRWPCLTKNQLSKGPGGTSGAHTQQLRGMVRLLRVPSPAPGACEHWLTVPV